MRKILRAAAALLLAGTASLIACKKEDLANPATQTASPFVAAIYPKGSAQEAAVQKQIDGSGGTLSSADGRFTVTVPAGAVTAATVFSVQAVSNVLPQGSGLAYRLLPEGSVFFKPITVTLRYTDSATDGADENAFDISRHDASGTWRALTNTQLSKATKTLTATTKKSGDFSFTGYCYLVPQAAELTPGQSTTLGLKIIPAEEKPSADDEIALGAEADFTAGADTDPWEKEGEGELESAQKTSAVYKAPASVSAGSVTIKTGVKHNKRSRNAGGKIFLKRKLSINSGSFFAGTYDGQAFTCTDAVASAGNGITMIQGVTAAGKQVMLIVHGTAAGNFPYGDPTVPGNSEIRTDMIEDVYETVYTTPCVWPPQTKYASGALQLKAFDNKTVAGEFQATLYDTPACSVKTKNISGSFRVRRI